MVLVLTRRANTVINNKIPTSIKLKIKHQTLLNLEQLAGNIKHDMFINTDLHIYNLEKVLNPCRYFVHEVN